MVVIIAVILLLIIVGVVAALLVYGYRNPTSTIGQAMIKVHIATLLCAAISSQYIT